MSKVLEDETVSHPWARVIIVAYNSGLVLQQCINCLALQTFPNFEVIIVDNQSSDGCVESVVLPDARFSKVLAPKNLGFAGGSNFGAQGARTKWIITLNPDAHASSTWLENLEIAAKQNPTYGMLSPMLLKSHDTGIIDGCGDVVSLLGVCWRGGSGQKKENAPSQICRVFAPCGASAIYRRDLFEEQGGFDESFFCYIEDVDLGLRMNKSGERCLLVPNAIVYHIGSSTLGDEHPLIAYLSSRNMVSTIIKSYPIINALIALPCFLGLKFWNVLRNPKQGMNAHNIRGLAVGLLVAPVSVWSRLKNKLHNRRWNTVLFLPMEFRLNAAKEQRIRVWEL